MSLRVLSVCAFILMAIVIAPSAICAQLEQQQKTPVEVWSGGDDGLTQRLKAAIEEELKSSVDFHLSAGKKPGTLVVTIPSNVSWKQIGERTEVLYTVNFTSVDGRNLGASKGRCWDGDLEKCSIRIVGGAKVAAHKLH